MTFGKWRQQLRLLRAMELLASGEKVTAAAAEAGYNSTSAFISMFRKQLGTTPTRYSQPKSKAARSRQAEKRGPPSGQNRRPSGADGASAIVAPRGGHPMSAERGFLGTVPRKSILIFLIGVFLLFSTVALASDMSDLGRQPMPAFVLSILVIGTFAVLYAIAGFTLRGQWWKGIVPIFVVQLVVLNVLHRWLPSLPPLQQMDAAAMAQVRSRLGIDGTAIVVAIGLGYACFVSASIAEGRRYFRVHAEIALAREIHEVLVPTIDTKIGGFEFYGRSSSSSEVGGDLIDLAGADGRWVAYLADVSGHGVAPGVVVGMTKSASRMLLRSGGGSEHLMPRLNEVLYPLKNPDMFVTFCFVASNVDRLRVGLAGHPSILQFCARTNEVTQLDCPNMPLGIVPSGEFATLEVSAESGTLFALYTDGLLETANKAGEEFGMTRLKAELQKHGREALGAICRSIQESVGRHGAQFDDQSILLIRKS